MVQIPDQFRLAVVLGAVLHNERIARALTQQQVAALAALHPMALSKIERGIQQDVGVDTLQRIATALSQVSPVRASELVDAAERWQYQLFLEWQQGTLPVRAAPPTPRAGVAVAAGALSGAALAAVILILMDRKKK
jgi:transcriptional regulator with XRE-family HTH domain